MQKQQDYKFKQIIQKYKTKGIKMQVKINFK